MLSDVLKIASTVISRVIPDPQKKAEAQARLTQLVADNELREIEVQMSAIVMEAKSKDPWTSRARPSFMYVFYILILMAIPVGVLHAFSPEAATNFVTGMQIFWDAIPSQMYTAFTVGYLGYAGARSFDKRQALKAGQ